MKVHHTNSDCIISHHLGEWKTILQFRGKERKIIPARVSYFGEVTVDISNLLDTCSDGCSLHFIVAVCTKQNLTVRVHVPHNSSLSPVSILYPTSA